MEKTLRPGDRVIITSGKQKGAHGSIIAAMGPQHYEVDTGAKNSYIIESARLELLPGSNQSGPDLERQRADEIIAQARVQAARAMSAADLALRAANAEHIAKELRAAAQKDFRREVFWWLKNYGEKETRALFNNAVHEWKEQEL